VLAVLIRNPSAYDPANDQASAQDRWGKVLDAMAQKGWLDGAQRAAATYPQVLPPPESSSLGIPSGPEGLAVQQAITELKGKGYPDDQIRAGGLRITTTVDKKAQDAAIAAVKDVMAGEPGGLRQALVAVDPKNGAVRAYYGGDKGAGSGIIDYAQARRAPGSSMKPYTLATALQQGISVNARRDGSSPQTFPDRPGKPVRNASNAQCAACSLREAITRSLNTTFYGLAYEVGADKVRDTALAATGMPDTWPKVGSSLDGLRTLSSPENGATGASIGIGEYEMRPIDQAIGFATFADGGVHHDPHFVEKVTDNEGNGLYALQDQGKQVVPSDVAHDVTYALEGVAAYSHRSLDGGRETASKTGTQGLNDNDNSDAWMVGYTPSISAAVWMGNDSPNQPIVNSSGRIVYGSGLPGAIWQEFMDSVLAGTPEEALPDRPLITGDTGKSVPLPVTTTTRVPDATTSRAPRTTTAAPRTTTAAPATTSEAPATTTQARPSPSSSPSSTAEDGSVAPGVPGFPSRGRGGTQTDDTQLAPAG
jgi:membrane peptidoglycan carboxypeptidase